MIDRIIEKKKQEIDELKSQLPLDELKQKIKDTKRERIFKEALIKDGRLSLIAELKKASPSKGILRVDFDLLKIAKIYERGKVDALSVLTEKEFFDGDINYIPLLKKNTTLPILQKDFLIDEYQLYHAVYLGADAILLITSILNKRQMTSFIQIANALNLDVLVEVHSKEDVKKALDVDAEIIGINNRDLKTFNIDIKNTERLIPLIKEAKDKIIVSESGIETEKDIIYLKNLGVNAILVGEAFMRSENILSKINEIKRRL
ncbi:MAG TPA: indole-3-glycerol phosphate synthase TrpC [Candidatus Omnitrophica bacterium]|nr:indole-3-glycerol phosphate synthase TrpC [Candidatus Omnitrophota bacterium]